MTRITTNTENGKIRLPSKYDDIDDVISLIQNSISSTQVGLEEFEKKVNRIEIDHKFSNINLDIKIKIPNNKRKDNKLILGNSNVSILSMISSNELEECGSLWVKDENNRFVIKLDQLPTTTEDFLIRIKNALDRNILEKLIEWKIATDPADDGGKDRYWIYSAIPESEILRSISANLHISNVDAIVKVTVQRCFSTAMPNQLRLILEARNNLLKAVSSGDRNWKARAEYRMKKIQKDAKFNERDIVDVITELLSEKIFRDYISATEPYYIGDISPEHQLISPIPRHVDVDINTNLSMNRLIARGYLFFSRNEYKERIAKLMKSRMKVT